MIDLFAIVLIINGIALGLTMLVAVHNIVTEGKI